MEDLNLNTNERKDFAYLRSNRYKQIYEYIKSNPSNIDRLSAMFAIEFGLKRETVTQMITDLIMSKRCKLREDRIVYVYEGNEDG